MTNHKNDLMAAVLTTVDQYTRHHGGVGAGDIVSALLCAAASVVEDAYPTERGRKEVWAALTRALPYLAAEVEARIEARSAETLQ
jgi:hypothetical protein